MRYVILIYGDEKKESNDPAEMQKWFDYTDELRASGTMAGGEALHPTASATTVRVKNGKRVLTDGPFAETKEQLGGFYLIDVKDLDEALKWAEKIPSVGSGSIEVRPVVDFSAEQ
jgi:hypothetical protein